MPIWRYFKLEEFACPCCGRNEIDHYLVDLLDEARNVAGIPFYITSGFRCEKRNREVGGVPDSAHIKGLAADIYAADSKTRFKIVEALIEVGIQRIGIAKGFIHADIDMDKPRPALWLY